MSTAAIDTTSQAFAARLASLARAARRDRDVSVRAIARSTGGAVSARQLRAVEAEEADLSAVDIAAITEAYGIDLETLLGARIAIDVDAATGVLSTAGITRAVTPGDEDALLMGYLRLVRELRDQPREPTVALRRDDIELLAGQLGKDAALVLDRLGQLMGATVTQRRSTVAVFATGAALVILSTSATAIEPAMFTGSDDKDSERAVAATALLDDEASPDSSADRYAIDFEESGRSDASPTTAAGTPNSSPLASDDGGAAGQDGASGSTGSQAPGGSTAPDGGGAAGPGNDGTNDTTSSSPGSSGTTAPDLDVRVDAPGDGGPIEAPTDEVPVGGPAPSPTPISSPGTPSGDAGAPDTSPGTSTGSGNTGTGGDSRGTDHPGDGDPGGGNPGDGAPGSDTTGDSPSGDDAPGGGTPGDAAPGDSTPSDGTPGGGGSGGEGGDGDLEVVDTPENPGSQAPDNPTDNPGSQAPENPGSQAPDNPTDNTPENPGSQAPGDQAPDNPAEPSGPGDTPGDSPEQPAAPPIGGPHDGSTGTSPGNSNNAGNSGSVGQPGNSGNSQAGGGGTAGGGVPDQAGS